MNSEKLFDLVKHLRVTTDFLKCAICLDVMVNSVELNCKHKFCFQCIELYKNEVDLKACPICKKIIKKRESYKYDKARDSVGQLTVSLKKKLDSYYKMDVLQLKTLECVKNLLNSMNEKSEDIPVKVPMIYEGPSTSKNISTHRNSRGRTSVPHRNTSAVIKKGNLTNKSKAKATKSNLMEIQTSFIESREEIWKWLNDNKNEFDRKFLTQMSSIDLAGKTLDEVKLMSQKALERKTNKEKLVSTEILGYKAPSSRKRMRSLDIYESDKNESVKNKFLNRRSFGTETLSENAYKIEDVNTEEENGGISEKKKILGMIEDVCLDNLDKSLGEDIIEATERPTTKRKKDKRISKRKKKEISPGWKTIATLEKSINLPKVPKALDISVQKRKIKVNEVKIVEIDDQINENCERNSDRLKKCIGEDVEDSLKSSTDSVVLRELKTILKAKSHRSATLHAIVETLVKIYGKEYENDLEEILKYLNSENYKLKLQISSEVVLCLEKEIQTSFRNDKCYKNAEIQTEKVIFSESVCSDTNLEKGIPETKTNRSSRLDVFDEFQFETETTNDDAKKVETNVNDADKETSFVENIENVEEGVRDGDIDNNGKEGDADCQKEIAIADLSQKSVLVCTMGPPMNRLKINRKLYFENSQHDSPKRMRSDTTDADDEQRKKVPCVQLVRDDLSIVFETNTDDLENMEVDEQTKQENDINANEDIIFNRNDDIVNSIDVLVDKTNTLDHDKMYSKISRDRVNTIVSVESYKISSDDQNSDKSSQSYKSKEVNALQHYDNIIERASSKSTNVLKNEKPKTGFSASPKVIDTQELLDHCNELIKRVETGVTHEDNTSSTFTKNKERKNFVNANEVQTSVNSITSQKIDIKTSEKNGQNRILPTQALKSQPVTLSSEYFLDSQVLKKMDRDIEEFERKSLQRKSNENIEDLNQTNSKEDLNSISQKSDHLLANSAILENSKNKPNKTQDKNEDLNDSFDEDLCENAAMMEVFIEEEEERERKEMNEKKVHVLYNVKVKSQNRRLPLSGKKTKEVDNESIRSDEMFSDDDVELVEDVIETTPEKVRPSSFIQIRNDDIASSILAAGLVVPASQEDVPLSIELLPPPPGFGNDEDVVMEETPVIKHFEASTCGIIESSVSPQKPFLMLSTQEVMSLSPIDTRSQRNLNVIERVQQAKHSPLIITSPKRISSLPITASTPKQKSILNYVVKPAPASFSPPRADVRRTSSKPVVACTRLSKEQIVAVSSMANKKLVTYSASFSPIVTHMIVSSNARRWIEDQTMKFIFAVAAGIWVVGFEWVQECLAKNRIVPEEPFEVFDYTGSPGPKTSRLTRAKNPLLKGFKFYVDKFSSVNRKDVEDIIVLLGGVVVGNSEDLLQKNGYHCLIIIETGATEDEEVCERWLENVKVAAVDMDWLIKSVGQYKLQSLKAYTACSDETLYELGYPPHLLIDDVPSLCQ